MKSYDKPMVDKMRAAIINHYGPSIHNELVVNMPVDRIARIFDCMMRLQERSYVRNDCIKGQMSLFD